MHNTNDNMHDPVDNWNNRYSGEEYAYGELPNTYLKEQLKKLSPGKILFPGEGEGRNAVYAARSGWQVWAYDISSAGKDKAEKLARNHQVLVDYQVGELNDLSFADEQFDAIALIYTHFIKEERQSMYTLLDKILRPGGIVIAELFSKNHIEYQKKNSRAGGPRDVGSLFSVQEIGSYFSNYEIIELGEEVIELSEGRYHSGTASVVRFTGKKSGKILF